MGTPAQIICVGQAVVDCITENIDKSSDKKNVYRAHSISLNVGGDAFNESVILSRLGHSVQILCGMGNDLAGDLILSRLTCTSVDTSLITRSDSLSTPVANIILTSGRDRQSVSSEAARLEGYSPPTDGISGCRILSLASLFRAPLDRPEQILSLVKAARDGGAVICADTKLPTFRLLDLEDLRDVLPYIDYIFPNEAEASYYSGRSDYSAMADAFLNRGVGHVIIKTGAKGCFAKSSSECFSVPSFPVNAVDSTGAGDNFAAGFISALLHGEGFHDCCLFATAAAACSVTCIGTTSGVQSRRQVEEFLALQNEKQT